MKKSYQKPSIQVVPVRMSQMLCGSTGSFSIDSSDTNKIDNEEDQW